MNECTQTFQTVNIYNNYGPNTTSPNLPSKSGGYFNPYHAKLLGRACLAAGRCLTADPWVASLIPTRSHNFVEIDLEIISTAVLLSTDSRRVVIYKRKYKHEILGNRLVKLAQEKSVVRLTDHPNMTIAVDCDVKHQTKPKPC